MRKFKNYILSLLALLLLINSTAYAHGTKISCDEKKVYSIKATFDDGTELKNAQVIIFSPKDPKNPWGKGVTDDTGNYEFVPDTSIEGKWTIQIRQAGHGGVINIDTTTKGNSSISNGNNMSTSTKIIVVISVVWGFIGTALFFLRRKK